MIRFVLALTLTSVATSDFASCQSEGKLYRLKARASEIDPRAKEHPEIGFVFSKNGKPEDLQNACVDTRIAARGQLVIWLMAHNQSLFDRTASYGLHSIQVHYARGWFGKLYSGDPPEDDLFLSKVRLEATTGKDFSDAINIPQPDGMMGRAHQFVLWLDKENPEGNWKQFLSADGKGLNWEKVIIAGSSHGSTSSARFAKHRKVSRVVMFAGPRDQFDSWQGLPSATPPECYFGFSHILDMGWKEDHYPRSWQLLGLQKFGAVVDVDNASPPYAGTRRLISHADVGGDANRAHSGVLPGKKSPKDSKGRFLYEDVWRYLFTHPVNQTGEAVPMDIKVRMDHRER